MKHKVVFLAPIYDIAVSEFLGRGDRLDDLLFITNDSSLVRSLMSANMVNHIGTLERNSVCGPERLVAYATFPPDNSLSDNQSVENFLAVQLLKLHAFLDVLWLIQDNSASIENAFIETPDTVSTRIWSSRCTLADGSSRPTTFTRQALKEARELYRTFYPDTATWGPAALQEAVKHEVVEPEGTPLRRAIWFLSTARRCTHLSVKVANYCSALEALLVTTPSELTYRLSGRVAWLIGDGYEDRAQLFRKLKLAYDIRSKAVHGSFLSAKKMRNDLASTTMACDEILRGVIHQLLSNKRLAEFITGHGKDEDYEELLNGLTLGTPQDDLVAN